MLNPEGFRVSLSEFDCQICLLTKGIYRGERCDEECQICVLRLGDEYVCWM